jgi:hypothetical protein
VIHDQRHRQQQETAEQQRAGRHHHRIVLGQPQPEDRGAGEGDGCEQDDHLSEDIGIETPQRIEADDHGGSGESQHGPGKF